MAQDGPHIVEWSDHALVKAEMLGIPRADVERIVLEGHQGPATLVPRTGLSGSAGCGSPTTTRMEMIR
jgi:hypothetical protein